MVYVTGDMHADFSRFEKLKFKRGDTLIVCGDFGFIWDGGEKEEKILKKIGNKKYTTIFIDGTHENFDLLKQYEITELSGAKVRNIYNNLYYLMRGQVINLEGKKFFAFGGGESTEKEMRISCNKWWKEEMPSIEEMKDAVETLERYEREVDYIITHEPPTPIKCVLDRSTPVNPLNAFLNDVSKQVKFKEWIFGCFHLNRDITKKYRAIFNEVIRLD